MPFIPNKATVLDYEYYFVELGDGNCFDLYFRFFQDDYPKAVEFVEFVKSHSNNFDCGVFVEAFLEQSHTKLDLIDKSHDLTWVDWKIIINLYLEKDLDLYSSAKFIFQDWFVYIDRNIFNYYLLEHKNGKASQ